MTEAADVFRSACLLHYYLQTYFTVICPVGYAELSMTNERLNQTMHDDWERRAKEDASYYAAFGRRGQEKEEFFSTATAVLRTLHEEFCRFSPATDFRKLAAIEIGCGPGRLMVPMSQVFGHIAGVDISEEMVRLARDNLVDIPNSEVHQCNGSDLRDFDDESFDFCYSYAVFQHIPTQDIVWDYLREARRILKPGGLVKAHFNGLPVSDDSFCEPVCGWSLRAAVPDCLVVPPECYHTDTWSGARFRPEEIADFAKKEYWQLLSMEGFASQYLWVTARKPRETLDRISTINVRHSGMCRVTNTWTEDAVVPCSGRFASVTLRGCVGSHYPNVLI
jgi:SAM-dependent methyltransferase